MRNRDSLGGTVSCRVTGMFPGLGEPVFDKLDAELAKAVMSIGAVKGVEFGDGFGVSTRRGSEDNDAFCPGREGIEKRAITRAVCSAASRTAAISCLGPP